MNEETKNWVRPIICGLLIALVTWFSKYLWETGKMKTYIVDFIITFSPIIVGLLAFFIYWLIRDYRKIRTFSYEHEHAIITIHKIITAMEALRKKTEIVKQEESSTRRLDDKIRDKL